MRSSDRRVRPAVPSRRRRCRRVLAVHERGWKIGFHPAAVVWHHRRKTIRAFWKQQTGYGRPRRCSSAKWPEKYNVAGHVVWAGRVYGRGLQQALGQTQRIYHGVWGLAPFQSVCEPPPGLLQSLPLMPEWYLVLAALSGLSALGIAWPPLLWTLPFLIVATAASLAQALLATMRAPYRSPPPTWLGRLRLRTTTALLHLLQPLARLVGRIRHGLTPWRAREVAIFRFPRTRQMATLVSGPWESPQEKLTALERALRQVGAVVKRGGEFSRWDLEVQGGLLGGARVLLCVEDLCPGKQLVRFRSSPSVALWGLGLIALLAFRRRGRRRSRLDRRQHPRGRRSCTDAAHAPRSGLFAIHPPADALLVRGPAAERRVILERGGSTLGRGDRH